VSNVRWLDENEARAWRSLQMMQMRLNAELARDLAAHSQLSYPEYVVLVALTDRAAGEMRVFELGVNLGWEKSRVSHQVARMAARGLVEKRTCGADRRGQVVVVTARGREEIAAAAPSHLDAVRRLFVDRLTRAQLEQVATTAETILGAVIEEQQGRCRDQGYDPNELGPALPQGVPG
jgi:DNA-binding MarR family transcriptional regulator